MNKPMMKLFLALCLPVCAAAQDFHYSMWQMSPLTVNPANTGAFTGDLRIANNYRMQWSTIGKPFKTLTCGIDAPIYHSNSNKNDFFALGFVFNNDQAGTSALKTNLFQLSGAFNKDLSGVGENYITTGIQLGFGQRSMNLDAVSWDAQWNGIAYDATLPSQEVGGSVSYLYFDYSAGLLWTTTANDRFRSALGLAFSHLSGPNVGVYGDDRLYRKIAGHWTANVALGENSNAKLVPAVYISKQGPNRLINIGTGVKFLLQERSHYTGYNTEKSLTLGGMYRMKDAASGYIRFDYGSWGGAFSYDFNVSGLTVASNGFGALEFMAIYTGLYGSRKNTRMSNPSFF